MMALNLDIYKNLNFSVYFNLLEAAQIKQRKVKEPQKY